MSEVSLPIRVFHPTDFSPASEVAFAHALKLALASRGALTVFHFAHDPDAGHDVHEFPQVRETLTHWGLLPPNSPREAVATLGLRVRKVEVGGPDPTDAILSYLRNHAADLIVLATHQRSGVARWLYREVAAPLIRRSALAALFVPPGVDGFVEFNTGDIGLQRILMPIDQRPHPRQASRRCRQSSGRFTRGLWRWSYCTWAPPRRSRASTCPR